MTRVLRRYMALAFGLSAAVFSFSTHASPNPKLQPLRVYLDWTPDVEFAGIYAALEKGWYRDAGIDLKLLFNGLDIIPNVLAGQADVGMHSGHDVIRWAGKKQGKKLRAFAAQYQLNPNCIVVGKESSIHQVKDLKGKTLGIFSPQEYDMYRIMLAHSGLSLSDVRFRKIKTFKEAEIIQLLRTKQVDAIIAWEFNWTVTFALLGYEVRAFPGHENGFHYYGIVFFAPQEFIRTNKDLLTRFLKVTFDGWREVYTNPLYYARLVVEKHFAKDRYLNGDFELTLKQQVMELMLRQKYLFEGVGPERIGQMSRFKWQKSLDISKQFGMLPALSSLRVEDVYDSSILDGLFGEGA